MPKRSGYKPAASDITKGKCCECMCNYADGRHDCEHVNCPMYMRHPFRKLTPRFDWVFDASWARHDRKCREQKLTREEYVEKYIFNGKPILSRVKMYRAKCFDCCNNFREGRVDCGIRGCPLYYFMPYRKSSPIYNWMFDLAYTTVHRNRAYENKIYRRVQKSNGRTAIIINVNKYIRTYLPWIGPPPVRRIRKAADGLSESKPRIPRKPRNSKTTG